MMHKSLTYTQVLVGLAHLYMSMGNQPKSLACILSSNIHMIYLLLYYRQFLLSYCTEAVLRYCKAGVFWPSRSSIRRRRGTQQERLWVILRIKTFLPLFCRGMREWVYTLDQTGKDSRDARMEMQFQTTTTTHSILLLVFRDVHTLFIMTVSDFAHEVTFQFPI